MIFSIQLACHFVLLSLFLSFLLLQLPSVAPFVRVVGTRECGQPFLFQRRPFEIFSFGRGDVVQINASRENPCRGTFGLTGVVGGEVVLMFALVSVFDFLRSTAQTNERVSERRK